MNKKIKHDEFNSPWQNLGRPLLIAEIGGNHEGSFSKAKELLNLALGSEADVVKFQIYYADSLVSKTENPIRYNHFKKFELTIDQHIELAKICISKGKLYTASIWDIDIIKLIDPYVRFYKIGSGDLTAFPIIEKIVELKKPIILSTGLSNMDEVLDTVKFIQNLNVDYKNPEMLCILQCTSMYPINYSDVNLNVMTKFKEELGLSTGYSDHTIDLVALKIAANLGADVLEFHFTDDKSNESFRDHKVSLTKSEVKSLKKFLDLSTKIKGDEIKKLMNIELKNNHHVSFRRGIYLKKPIKKGGIIKRSNMIFLRPLLGTDARFYKELDGSLALKDINPLKAIYKNIDYKI